MIRRTPIAALILALALAGVAGVSPTRADEVPADDAARLASIRSSIDALEFEKAIAAIDAFLARSDLSDDARADALALRAQVHAATGDLDAAADDYKEILPLRPGFAPDPTLTSKKALDRFAKIRAATVGTLHLDLDPKDAALTLDGRPVVPRQDGSLDAVAGAHTLHVEHKGFDPLDVAAHVVAGQDTLLKVRLVPNAGSVIVRTDVPGVAVSVDGREVGTTAPPAGGAGGPAELLVPDLALGEHAVTLAKPCYATEGTRAFVSVDIDDRTPKPLPVATMREARLRIALSGASYPGEVRIDGAKAASLPADSLSTCAGRHTVEVVAGGRIVWFQEVELTAGEDSLDLAPRPNAVLVGAAWPPSWSEALASFSRRSRIDPPSGVDLTSAVAWDGIKLPVDTDLALGVIPRAGPAGEDRIVAYSPILGTVTTFATPPRATAPVWREATIGAVPVDAKDGSVVLVRVRPDGPAGRAGIADGSALLDVAGAPPKGAAGARARILAQPPGGTVRLVVAAPGGERHTVEVTTVAASRVAPPEAGESAIVRAAWASVVAAASGDEAASALANLAVLLEDAGKPGAALGAWRKAAALDPAAFAPRADYAEGVSEDAAGNAARAKSLFRKARAGAAAAGDALLEAAATDRLADLGVDAAATAR